MSVCCFEALSLKTPADYVINKQNMLQHTDLPTELYTGAWNNPGKIHSYQI